jgi:hypothetical protein
VERITMPIFTKLFAISKVANNFLGLSKCSAASLSLADKLDLKSSISYLVSEK